MSYQLILSESRKEVGKDVGENIFLDNLPLEYKVYLFYYPGSMPNENLEERLKGFGKITGKNLFVNIGRLNDPQYGKIKNKFQIRNFPVIILTAIDELASLNDGNSCYSTAYVRLDNKELFESVESTIECVEILFNLFIDGEITEALNQANNAQHDAIVYSIKKKIINVLNTMGKFLSDRDISVSLFEGKFELKKTIGPTSSEVT